jgi:hypothetical protein
LLVHTAYPAKTKQRVFARPTGWTPPLVTKAKIKRAKC